MIANHPLSELAGLVALQSRFGKTGDFDLVRASTRDQVSNLLVGRGMLPDLSLGPLILAVGLALILARLTYPRLLASLSGLSALTVGRLSPGRGLCIGGAGPQAQRYE
jgi:hypothetical protein